MTLRGNLRDFTIPELLTLVNLAQKTGTLIVDGPSEQAYVSFRKGKLAYARIGLEDDGLANVLYKANKLNANQYQSVLKSAGPMTDKELGILLINAGYVSQEEILIILQSYYSDVVRRLFPLVDGSFRFDNDLLPPDDRINVKLDVENLIIEGTRHLREEAQLRDEIPSLDMTLKFTEHPLTNIRLSMQEWRVVKYVDPKNSIKQIASATKLNDMEIRRIVNGLIQAGLVQMVNPATGTLLANPKMFPTQDKKEQRGLIQRLIHRIQKL